MTRVIGMFDSGVGGLSVARAVRAQLPWADILYIADSAWFPYGSKTPAQLQRRTELVTRSLLGRGATLVVAACNSASGAAITHLRASFDVPFVGVEPAVKVAADSQEVGRVGVLCTEVTAGGGRYQQLLRRVAGGMEVVTAPSPALAPLVEAGSASPQEIDETVARALAPLLEAEVDAIVLGCTHYAFLEEPIARLSGLPVLEPSRAVARQVERLYGGTPKPGSGGALHLLTSGDVAKLAAFAERQRLGASSVGGLGEL